MIAHLRIEKRPDIPNDPSLKTNSNKGYQKASNMIAKNLITLH
jgi:hypothetical protein